MENKRLHFIDGYKGLLCFMIMQGHFWNIYRLTSGVSPLDHGGMDGFVQWGSKWFLIASFWLYAFLIISGYLLSRSKVKSIPDLLIKTVSRFLRLFIPILGACLVIFVLAKTVGFHAQETRQFFKSTWFQKFYQEAFVWYDVITESFRAMFNGACEFNAPFWVIKDMLLSSVLIYGCKLLAHALQKKLRWIPRLLPLLLFLGYFVQDSQVVAACLAGFLIGYYEDDVKLFTEKFWKFCLLFAMLYGGYMWLMSRGVRPAVFDKVTGYTLIHCFLLITLNRFSVLQRIFSAKPFFLAGKISFGVYAFHWPVICSVGSLLLILGIGQSWDPVVTVLTAFFGSVVATVALSVGYLFTVEKFGDFLVKQVRSLGGLLTREKPIAEATKDGR